MIRHRTISVIGGSQVSTQIYQLAFELGREIAKRNFVLITGGRTGVMEAVSKGCQVAGGLSIGILPGDFKNEANNFVNVAIPTGLGEARNIIVVRAGDGIIAVAAESGFGTLSELAFAQILKKPLVILNGNELIPEFLNTTSFHGVPQVGTPIEAVHQIETMLKIREK
ncbi:MAG: TIGR00725 family protein [Candidatus Heimdallarchaeota archaeon]